MLTKLLRSLLEIWRKEVIMVFTHIDDGIGFVKGIEKALAASRKVREDLRNYGL